MCDSQNTSLLLPVTLISLELAGFAWFCRLCLTGHTQNVFLYVQGCLFVLFFTQQLVVLPRVAEQTYKTGLHISLSVLWLLPAADSNAQHP